MVWERLKNLRESHRIAGWTFIYQQCGMTDRDASEVRGMAVREQPRDTQPGIVANQFHGDEQKIDDAKSNQSMTGPTRSLGQGATTDAKSKS